MTMAGACKELAALSRFLGDNAYAQQLLEQRAALVETINRKAWDGEWYLRAFSKFGPVGSKSSPTGGNIYINPQVWSILADVVPENRLDAVLTAIDKMDKKYGIQLCEPAYPHYDSHVGRMSGMLPGLFENGGVYNHCNAFKIMADPFVGKLAFFRVYSGSMAAGSYVLNATKDKKERVGRILQMHANKRMELDKVYSGDIAAAIGFKFTTTGDTICDEQHPVILESMEFPEPVIELAIEPKTKAGQGKLGESLAKLAEEDPTFRAHTDQETGQTI